MLLLASHLTSCNNPTLAREVDCCSLRLLVNQRATVWKGFIQVSCSELKNAGGAMRWLSLACHPQGALGQSTPGGSQGLQALCSGGASQIPDKELALGKHSTGGDRETRFCLTFLVPFSLGLSFPLCTESCLTQPCSHSPVGQLAL